MFLAKVKGKESGLLLYGITPPKASTALEKVSEIAGRSLATLRSLDIDALVVYDVQDEAERTTEERPFPFASSLDPFHYASTYLHELKVPKIIYRPAGKFTRDELALWLNDLKSNGFYPVFVGIPSPDFVPKTSLADAYKLWRDEHQSHSVIGAVTIPERHAVLKDEQVRMLDKAGAGVSYFISQCVFNVDYAKQMLSDLKDACDSRKQPVPTVIFTLTICGSLKTLQFMEWLGIHIPESMKEELKVCASPVARSVEIATDIAKELIRYCKDRSIPFGFNIESVAIRKEEIEASLGLLNSVRELLKANGLRSVARETTTAGN